jgi:hypothetical protein
VNLSIIRQGEEFVRLGETAGGRCGSEQNKKAPRLRSLKNPVMVHLKYPWRVSESQLCNQSRVDCCSSSRFLL